MSPDEIRLECLRLALARGFRHDAPELDEVVERFAAIVMKKGAAVPPDETKRQTSGEATAVASPEASPTGRRR